MATIHDLPVISPQAAPEGWLDGFLNEDGSPMTRAEYDDLWENHTPPSDLAAQVAAGEWDAALEAHAEAFRSLLLPVT